MKYFISRIFVKFFFCLCLIGVYASSSLSVEEMVLLGRMFIAQKIPQLYFNMPRKWAFHQTC